MEQLNAFLADAGLSLNYPSKKFLLLFICLMQSRPIDESMQLSYRLPLAPLNMHFSDNPPGEPALQRGLEHAQFLPQPGISL